MAGSALATSTVGFARLDETTQVSARFDSEPLLLCVKFWKEDELSAALARGWAHTVGTTSRPPPLGMSCISAQLNLFFARLAEVRRGCSAGLFVTKG